MPARSCKNPLSVMECDPGSPAIAGHAERAVNAVSPVQDRRSSWLGRRPSASVSRGDRHMLCLRRRFQPTIIRIVAGTALACMGSVALASASQAAAVTFNYTGADVSYTISPGTYRISVFGAQGGSTEGEVGLTAGGRGAEASAIYQIGQTLDLRIGVGGTAPGNEFAACGG